MGTDMHNTNKPSNPAPPLNALHKPEVRKSEKTGHRSVYDEIAERRKREKHRIGVTSHDSRDREEEVRVHYGDEVEDIVDELKHREDDDVKVYNPDKSHSGDNTPKSTEPEGEAIPEYPVDIYSDDGEEREEREEDNYDVPPIPKQRRRLSPWVAVISALSALCVIAAGAYGVVNGYFDSLISML